MTADAPSERSALAEAVDGALLGLLEIEAAHDIGKHWSKDKDGNAVNKVAGELYAGWVYERQLPVTPSALQAFLEALAPARHAVMFGAFAAQGPLERELTTKARLSDKPGAMARTRDGFVWRSGPSVFAVDIDSKAVKFSDAQAALDFIVGAMPDLAGAPVLVAPSSSSCIYDGVREVHGPRGWHLYFIVANGRMTPTLRDLMETRLWACGAGEFAVSKSGALLERCGIDLAVYQPERLWFSAGATCVVPLNQRRWVMARCFNDNAAPFDIASLPGITPDERARAEANKAAAKEKARAQAAVVRAQWEAAFVGALVATGVREDAAKEIVARSLDGVLMGAFVLYLADGRRVTAAEMDREPWRYAGQRCADPLDPDYWDKRIAIILYDGRGRLVIFSHRHGGQRFVIVAQLNVVRLLPGESPRAVREAAQGLADAGVFFLRGDKVARVTAEGDCPVLSEAALMLALELVNRYIKQRANSETWNVTDCTERHVKAVRAAGSETGLPTLNAVATAPLVLPSERLLNAPGFDADSGVMLVCPPGADFYEVAARPTLHDAADALRRIWEVIAGFPFVGPEYVGAAFAALLTAHLRPVLRTAPAFVVTATTAGTGKTLLSQVIAAMLHRPAVFGSMPLDDQREAAKELMGNLRAGIAGKVIDNVVTGYTLTGCEPFASVLTSETWGVRLLGVNDTEVHSTRVLWLITGNNISVGADFIRRTIVIDMDARVERPELRRFTFDPHAAMRARRQEMAAALNTLVLAWFAAGSPRPDTPVGSYDDWDTLVRSPLVWLARELPSVAPDLPVFADPYQTTEREAAEDPDITALSALLPFWLATWPMGARVADVVALWKDRRCDHYGHYQPSLASVERQDTPALDALEAVARRGSDLNTRVLGKWLSGVRGRVVAGLRLESRSGGKGVACWFVECVGPKVG
ncbi:hypothetical protein [Niveibacterium sp.]|uniref:hypothetical protein n=1 Tax=Niveibacterium sp. TaxID=2017444 RepID=UPI0035B3BB09